MAAALFRRGAGLCCIHRELCRVVWRPQTALFSSKPSDRKQLRRTHIKKAKPQAPIDIKKLVETLFSLKRSDARPLAVGKAQHGKASPKPSTTSSVTSSTVSPYVAAFSAASSFKPAHTVPNNAAFSTAQSLPQPEAASPANPKTPEPHPQTQVSSAETLFDVTLHSPSASSSTSVLPETESISKTIETKTDVATEASSFPSATVETFTPTTVESSVESSFPPEEAQDTKAALTEGPVGSTVDVLVDDVVTSHSGIGELSMETTVESSVESSIHPEEAAETRATVVEGTAEPIADVIVNVEAQEVSTSKDSGLAKEELLIETTLESNLPPKEALEMKDYVAVESSVDTTVDILSTDAFTKGADLALVDKEELLMETTLESPIEPSFPHQETVEMSEGTAELTVETVVKEEAQEVETKSIDLGLAKEELLIETSQVEASVLSKETLETSSFVEDLVEPSKDAKVVSPAQDVQTSNLVSGMMDMSPSVKEEPLIESLETTIESPVEGSSSSVGTLEAGAAAEITIEEEAAAIVRHNTDISLTVKEEKLIDTMEEGLESEAVVSDGTIEPKIKSSETNDLLYTDSIQNAIRSASLPLGNEMEASSAVVGAEEEVRDPEKMTLDSLTLHLVQASVESLQTEELLRTTSELDEIAAVVQADEYKAAAPRETESKDEGEVFTEVLSKWESLSEDLKGLEGESSMLVNELLSSIPTVVSQSPATLNAALGPTGDSGASKEDPAMTLESITLAAVEKEVGSLETEVLEETRKSLEREAEEKVKEEKMQVETIEDVEVFEAMTDSEMITLESISEATDAIEAETSIMMEAMFGSEQGPKQLTDTKLQEVRAQKEVVGQVAEAESNKERGDVLEAMSLESVTLAEVEASLGTLENDSLNETTDYLEKEAEGLAVEGKKSEDEGMATTEGPDVDALSLPEADTLSEDLQTDALIEELLFTVPGHTTIVTDHQEVQEVQEVQEDTTVDVEDTVMDADLDPVQRLFLEKIREYNKMRRLNGGMLEAEPDYQKHLSEETSKLQKLYGGGDLRNFPQFTFPEPKMDQDSK